VKPPADGDVQPVNDTQGGRMQLPILAAPRSGFTLRSIRIGLIVLNVLVVVLCAWMLQSAWRREIREAESHAFTAARLLEQGVSATFDKVSVALNGVGSQLERQLSEGGIDQAALGPLAEATAVQIPELEQVIVFDTTGQEVCGVPSDRCRQLTIADRDYFALLRDRPDGPPALFGPHLSRPTNEPSLIMARALRTPDRAFAGVVVAALPLARLQALLAAAQLGPNGAASLRTANMELLARASRHAQDADVTLSAGVSERLRQTLSRSPDAAVYRAVTASDGVDRVAAYRRLPNYPVYVLVGEATQDFLGAWWTTAAWAGGFLILIAWASLTVERVARTGLREHDRAQSLYDQAPCGYHTLDPQGYYLSINATELQWLGCAREDVVGKLRPSDFFTDESKAAFARSFPGLKIAGHLDDLPYDLVSRQGAVRRVLVSARAVADDHGRFLMSNAVMHDVSELSRAQDQAREVARLQSLMLDTELVGLALLKGRRVAWANRGMQRIFGYSGDEWHDMPARRLHADEAAYQGMGIGHAQLQAGEPYRAELQLLRKDGSLCWMDVGAAPLRADADEVMLLVADISAQKASEAARLREVELRAQNEQLIEGDRLKDEFLSNMSHELRTPLNVVIGFAELLQMSGLAANSPDDAESIRLISESGEHLLRLVQTMLDFGHAASGSIAFAPEPLIVLDALEQVVALLEAPRLAAGVTITLVVEPSLDTVVNDPLLLRQMLLNLAENAVKFSKPGGAVTLRARGLEPDRWCVEVEDQGIGIHEDDLDRLFTPFVQLSSGSNKAYGGTGLGLALVWKIATAQGGEVQVRSRLGAGSVFTLVLPRILAARPEPVALDSTVR